MRDHMPGSHEQFQPLGRGRTRERDATEEEARQHAEHLAQQKAEAEELDEFPNFRKAWVWLVAGVVVMSTIGASLVIDLARGAL